MAKIIRGSVLLSLIFLVILVLLIVLMLGGCCVNQPEDNSEQANYTTIDTEPLAVTVPLSNEAVQCFSFIHNRLTSPLGGIYTNYQNNSQTADLSSGHEILSESMGLQLEYARLIGDQQLFNQTTDYIEKNLLVNDILLWRIVEGAAPITDVSATIDDLRIYETLAQAQKLWSLNASGLKLSETLENQLPSRGFQSNYLVNYYGASSPTQDNRVEMAYLNLSAITALAQAEPKMTDALETNKKLLLGSFISETLPLYHKSYNPQRAVYEDADGKINILDSLMVMLNMAKMGIYSPKSLDWLEEKVVSGTLYSYYDPSTGEALDQQESSAAYGLAAQIGAALSNDFLTGNALTQLKIHQNTDQQSPFYGGFAYNGNAYSYDNLQALLGLVYNQ